MRRGDSAIHAVSYLVTDIKYNEFPVGIALSPC